MDWLELQSREQLEEITSESENPSLSGIAIFKHSTRCGISAMAKRSLESDWDFPTEKLPIYHLDLLRHRPISDQIAKQFSVHHESPQLLVIKGGQCVYHASHHSIQTSRVRQAVDA